MGEGGGAWACFGVLRCALPSPAQATPTSVQASPPPSQVLSDDLQTQLFRLTMRTSDKWKIIGRHLGFGNCELDAIVHESGRHGDDDYYGAMLRQGLDGAPIYHDYPHLVTALYLARKERIANLGEGKRRELFGMLTGIM